MIACPTIQKVAIRRHYDQATLFYRLFWGRHLHHGLWRDNESPIRAQQNLVDELVRLGRIESGERVLDVGCGMGGSSLFLAKQLHCDVVGLTLSRFQQRWCSLSARCSGVHRRARFECADAELASFEPQSFDVVWSVESTEHFFDKPGYFRRAATWLRPTGRMVVCAWLAAESPSMRISVSSTMCAKDSCVLRWEQWMNMPRGYALPDWKLSPQPIGVPGSWKLGESADAEYGMLA